MTIPTRHLMLCVSALSMGLLPGVAVADVGQHGKDARYSTHHSSIKGDLKGPTHAARAMRARALHGVSSHRIEEVIVTGSMLSTSKNSNANPVQIISSKQIMQTGVTSLNDALQRMPSVGSNGQNNTTTNGGGGAACIDLRNLGSNRVLVLIDGKRTALNAQASCVDLNTIPMQLVDSVEILKDGGSELYGADAVSGVINIKLRHDTTKGGILIRGGITGHGDGKNGILSAYKGWNFDEGRGNITVSGSYNTTEGIRQKNRGWAHPVEIGTDGTTFGSGTSPQPLWLGDNGNPIPGQPPRSRYDFTQDSWLTNSVNTGTLYGDAHYDFNKHFTLYSNVLYSHRNSLSQMAPQGFFGSVTPSTLPSNLTVPANYPGNPFRQDATMATRRFTEFGPRRFENASDTYTAKVGLKGEIIANWMYDASFTYGWNQVLEHDENMGNYAALLNEYGLRQINPGNSNSALAYDPSLCPSSGCVSPFKPLSGKAAAYANATTNQHSYYQLRDWNLRIHNNQVTRMPWENGGRLGIALGMEHRGEQLSQTPDPLVSSGQSMGNATTYTGGGFHVTEGYAESNINLLHNAFLAKDLTIDGQGRVSGYNNMGITKNWKASINWMPTRDVRFRGTIGTSYRQPQVYELYQGEQISYIEAQDPCDMNQISTYGAQQAAVAARCGQQGINTKKFVAQGSGQVPTMSGGNSHLHAETSRTYTFGAVFTPRWVPRLMVSAEYWHTNVNQTIGVLGTQYVLDQCYTSGNLCGSVQRYNNNGHQIKQVTANTANLGGLRTSGIDFDLNYSLILTPYDVVSLSNTIQQLVTYKQQNSPGGPWYNYSGRLLYNASPSVGQPKLRDYATVTWRHNNFSITYMMQYMSGMTWNNSTRDLTLADGPRYKTPDMFEHDVTLNYRMGKWNFEGGINNITNKRPPFVADGTQNTVGNMYGGYFAGRSFFMQANVDF
ncbi:TonB-dependent receptor [Saccharibacter sp. 17.LH.SD]|uniref:TonB-dependent receptor plug domain-containing protein n=1 Tax=Saccharibacter sp. 17.LH.SD TaxID=2689393 RepID=UPI00136D1300|nr:TonB-dependent receptor [Saccharibacter sp. 17.LH.SD]MXV44163.1 TonB-dependent receptor [Saccharibacter sp. 17.LH.SD]